MYIDKCKCKLQFVQDQKLKVLCTVRREESEKNASNAHTHKSNKSSKQVFGSIEIANRPFQSIIYENFHLINNACLFTCH